MDAICTAAAAEHLSSHRLLHGALVAFSLSKRAATFMPSPHLLRTPASASCAIMQHTKFPARLGPACSLPHPLGPALDSGAEGIHVAPFKLSRICTCRLWRRAWRPAARWTATRSRAPTARSCCRIWRSSNWPP